MVGDDNGSLFGWWVDDVRLYSLPERRRLGAGTTVAAKTTSATVSWTEPEFVGSSPIASYRISRSDGKVTTSRRRTGRPR